MQVRILERGFPARDSGARGAPAGVGTPAGPMRPDEGMQIGFEFGIRRCAIKTRQGAWLE
jgi:hypothetical protein